VRLLGSWIVMASSRGAQAQADSLLAGCCGVLRQVSSGFTRPCSPAPHIQQNRTLRTSHLAPPWLQALRLENTGAMERPGPAPGLGVGCGAPGEASGAWRSAR